ncbi:hypothetical protein NL50_16645 [Clostridium acetobutylicum]|nr:hypothetical protein NL50_16645 [Clostridium acetobutylicum]
MNNIKKTLLIASVLALGTKMGMDLNAVKAYAAENVSSSKIVTSEKASESGNNAVNNNEIKASDNSYEEQAKNLQVQADTKKNVQDTVNNTQTSSNETDEEKLIASINVGSENLSDYNSLGFTNVKPDNIKVMEQQIKNARTSKGADLTKDEIGTTIANTSDSIKGIFDRMTKGTAVVSDYQFLLITQVNSNNLQDINSWLTGKRYALISKILSTVDKITTAVSNINNANDHESDFTALQIYNVQEDLVPFLNENISAAKKNKGSDLSSSEINTVVKDSLSKLQDALERINLGQGTLDDYHFIGAANVDENNLEDVNGWANGKGWFERNNAIEEINSIVEPLSRINSGDSTAGDYDAIQVDGVDDNNIDNIKSVIAEKKQLKGKNLNIAEIKSAVEEYKTVLDFYDLIKKGTAKVSDYNAIGLTGVTEDNVTDMNELLKNRDIKTLNKLQDNINSIIKSLKNINAGTDTPDDYTNLNISSVTQDNISFIRDDIKTAKQANGSDLNKGKIQDSVNNSLKRLSAMDRINAGGAALDDYNLLGIEGVTSDNLTFVNNQVKGSNCKTIDELKTKVSDALKLYDSYNKVNNGDATYDDYVKIGIVIKIEDVTYYNGVFKGKNYFTFEELKVGINIAVRVRISTENIKNGVGSVEDYTIAGYTGVTEENIKYINKVIIEGGDTSPEAISNIITEVNVEIQSLKRWSSGQVTAEDVKSLGLSIVTEENISYIMDRVVKNTYYSKVELIEAVEAIIKEKEIYERINLGQATVADYEYIKVTGVTSVNITSINDYVKSGNLTTKEELQAKIDVVIEQTQSVAHTDVVIGRVNLGEANISDFEFMGITVVNSFNIQYVDDHLKDGKYTTIDAIKAAVTVFVGQYSIYEEINKGTATLDIYNSLGITGVTTENITYINLNIKESSYFNASDIQTKVNALISVYGYYEEINKGEATVDVYTSLGITGVTKENIIFINTYIKEGQYFDLTSLKSSVEVLEEKYEAYVKITSGKAVVGDYTKVGIKDVTEENIAYINLNIDLQNCFDTPTVQARIEVLVKQYNSYIVISKGSATVEDYEDINITGVTKDNIKYINCELKGTNFTESAEVQAKVDEVVKVYEELVRINLGTASVNDYTAIGVTGVADINIALVNQDMKEKGYLSVEEIKQRIDAVFSLQTVLGRINSSEGSLSDYEAAGAVGVTNENLAYVNTNIKGKLFESLEDVKVSVNEIVAQYEISIKIEQIVQRINLGTASVSDYNYIEITSVTDENVDAINADFKGKGYSDIEEIRERVNVIIKIKAALDRVNSGTASLEDFSTLGITEVYKDILVYVNSDLKGLNYKTIEDVQKRIDEKMNVYVFLNKVNLGEAVLTDYTSLNITGIDASLFVYVNEDLKGKNYTTIQEVQDRISSMVSIYAIIEKINKGQAVLTDYSTLGITNVDSSIIIYINADLQGKGFKTVEEIEERISAEINIYKALQKINAGEAVLSDYGILGITGLDSNLVVYANADLQGKNYTNVDEVKVTIEQDLNVYQILKKINDGTASLNDYSEVNITEVIDYNLYYVNARIKGANLVTLEAVQERILNLVNSIKISTASGYIKDASTGNFVVGAAIKFKINDGTNIDKYLSKNGVEIVVYTDANGKYSIDLPEGNYTAVAQMDGYIAQEFSIIANEANESVQQNTALVPIRNDEKYSIVLTWGAVPRDLDSHLTGTTADGTILHVNYNTKKAYDNGKEVASLDVDDQSSYGPETVTLDADGTGTYKYSVFDYSDQSSTTSNLMSNSGAKVNVYKGNQLVKTYTISPNEVGDVWNVFQIVNGQIVDVNTVGYAKVPE